MGADTTTGSICTSSETSAEWLIWRNLFWRPICPQKFDIRVPVDAHDCSFWLKETSYFGRFISKLSEC